MITPLTRASLAVLTLGWLSTTWGQALLDPTRPPAAWMPSQARAPGARAQPGSPDDELASPPPVQLLLVGATRKYAIVRGELVGVGERSGSTKLIDVKPTEVIVQSDRGLETLSLFPDVVKSPAKQGSGAGIKKEKK